MGSTHQRHQLRLNGRVNADRHRRSVSQALATVCHMTDERGPVKIP
jgi:hypothetical protein